MRFLGWMMGLASLAFVACGGKVEVDAGSGSGGGGVTMVTAATAGAGGSGTGSDTCPANEPTDGAPCSAGPDVLCDYGVCCPDPYKCVDGKWQKVPVGCPAIQCPEELPAPGSACTCYQGKLCSYGPDETSASCDGTSWTVTCGGKTCAAGELCVSTIGGSHCAPNDCGDAKPSCACTKACAELACTGVSGAQVFCAAP